MGITNVIYSLEAMGLTDLILPFMLVFTVVFAILQKSKLFGDDSKKYNIILGLVMGLLVVIPHVTGKYPAGMDAVQIINQAIPSVSIMAIAIIMFMVLAGIFIEPKQGGWLSGLVIVLSLIGVTWIFGHAAGWWEFMPLGLDDPDVQAIVMMILVFGVIIWFITSEPIKGKGFFETLKQIGKDA